jgi:hypothetical protein
VPSLDALVAEPFLASFALHRLVDHIRAADADELFVYLLTVVLWIEVRGLDRDS